MKSKILLGLILLALIGLTLGLSGCSKDYYVKKYCNPSTNIRDSVVLTFKDSIRIVLKDSTVITKGGKVESNIKNPCDEKGNLKPIDQTFVNGNNKTSIKSDGNNLIIKSDCEDQINKYKEQVAYLLTQVGENKTHTEYQTQVIEVKLTWWERLKSGVFGDVTALMAISFLVYLGFKLKIY